MAKFGVTGFTLAQKQPPKPEGNWNLYSIEEIHWDDDDLNITLRDGKREITIIFQSPTSFRSQDERDMLEYWNSRSSEKVEVATIYTINQSPYLEWIEQGATALSADLRLWLIIGINQCVEVICEAGEFPSIEITKEGEDR